MPAVLRALLLLVAAMAGAAAGLLGSFVHPLNALLLPIGLVLGFALSGAVFVMAGLLIGRSGAVAAGAGWLLTVLLLASPRPEGDLVVPGSTGGYLWLFGGTLLAAGCMALPYPRLPRPGAEPSATPGGGR